MSYPENRDNVQKWADGTRGRGRHRQARKLPCGGHRSGCVADSSTPLGRSEGGNQLYDAGTASGAILVSATRAPNRLYSSPTSPNAEVLVICKSPSSPVISI